jgi:hypothetical protein
MVTSSTFNTVDLHRLGATVTNLVATAIWPTGYVYKLDLQCRSMLLRPYGALRPSECRKCKDPYTAPRAILHIYVCECVCVCERDRECVSVCERERVCE